MPPTIWRDAAPVGQRRRESQKHQVAAGHERIGQTVRAHRDRNIAGQRGVGDFRQRRNFERVALAELCRPVRPQRFHAGEQIGAAVKLDGVALAVVEAQRFDPRKALRAPRPGRSRNPARRKTAPARFRTGNCPLILSAQISAHGAGIAPIEAAPIGGNCVSFRLVLLGQPASCGIQA